jgi:hypothetical protein
VENVTLLDCLQAHGNDISLLTPAFTIGVVETHRAVFPPGGATTLDHRGAIEAS